MFFKNKWKEENRKLYGLIEELREEKRVRKRDLQRLKDQVLDLETNYLKLESLSISKRILELREEALELNRTPYTLYLPYSEWLELRSELTVIGGMDWAAKDTVSIFGMRVKLTSKEMRVE